MTEDTRPLPAPELVSRTVVKQRIRNRLIEYFEFASTYEGLATFGVDEALELWVDWVSDGDLDYFDAPIFSPAEQTAIHDFNELMHKTFDSYLDDTSDVEFISKQPHWQAYASAAARAFKLFEQRGRFSEEKEVVFDSQGEVEDNPGQL